jgi:hypothetical protein
MTTVLKKKKKSIKVVELRVQSTKMGGISFQNGKEKKRNEREKKKVKVNKMIREQENKQEAKRVIETTLDYEETRRLKNTIFFFFPKTKDRYADMHMQIIKPKLKPLR